MATILGSARSGARTIADAFEEHRRKFHRITRRARLRFEGKDWAGGQRDAGRRLELYRRSVDLVVACSASTYAIRRSGG